MNTDREPVPTFDWDAFTVEPLPGRPGRGVLSGPDNSRRILTVSQATVMRDALTGFIDGQTGTAIEQAFRDKVAALNYDLGPTLVAALAGTRTLTGQTVWLHPGAPMPGMNEVRRVEVAHAIWVRVTDSEGPGVARLWFTGGNPWLGGDTPLTGIREDRFDAVTAAATNLIDGTFSG